MYGVVVLFVVFAGGGVYFGGKKIKGAVERRRIRKGEELLKWGVPEDLEGLIKLLDRLSKLKDKIQKFISGVGNERVNLANNVNIKEGIRRAGGMQRFVDEVLKKKHNELNDEEKSLKKLFNLDVKLESYLPKQHVK